MTRRYALAGLLLLMLAGVMAARTATAGGTVHPVALAQHPHAVVVDTRTSRAFITSHGADRRSGVVSVVDTTTGTLVRTVRLGTYPDAIAVNERTTRVFIGRDDGTVSLLDARSGAVLGCVVLPHDSAPRTRSGIGVGNAVVQGLAVDERTGRVFVASLGMGGEPLSRVSMLDGRSGAILHSMAVEDPATLAVDARAGRVLIMNQDGSVRVLDARTAMALHGNPVRSAAGAVAVDERTSHVFVADQNGTAVNILDARTGTLLHTTPVGQTPVALAMAAQTGRVFVVTANNDAGPGSVSMLDARTGAVLRTVTLAGALTGVAVDERRGRVFVTNAGTTDRRGTWAAPGSVQVLDAHSGALVRTIPTGVAPLAAAVDGQGHVVVINGGGTVRVRAAWWMQRLRPWLPWLRQPPPSTRTVPANVSVLDASG
jgi:YVTN family beta-propeller protein